MGAHIVIADLDEAAARETAGEIVARGGAAFAQATDIVSEASVEAMCEAAFARWGRIDILVNNAGIAIRRPAVDLPLPEWEKVMSVNTTGSFLCARAAARRMIAGGRGGAVVNLASIMGFVGGGLYPNISYQTSKGAIVNMTRGLATEWAPHGIRVNAVAPTYVRTRLTEPLFQSEDLTRKILALTPLGRLAEPEDIAAAIAFLASPGAAMITGAILPVDGGYLAQ